MRIDTRANYFLAGVFAASVILPFLDSILTFSLIIALFIYLTVVVSLHYKKKREQNKNILKIKKTKEHKALEKINKKREIIKHQKHDNINNQVAYISQMWELSRDQQKTFKNFIEKRAYSDLYTKMTASLLPQLIKMIEICLEQNKTGCKREVQRRLNDLTRIMKAEISKTKAKKRDDFETMSEVYDKLLTELKP